MRFRLRTLLIVLAIGPSAIAGSVWLAQTHEMQLTWIAAYSILPIIVLSPLVAANVLVWWLRQRGQRRFNQPPKPHK